MVASPHWNNTGSARSSSKYSRFKSRLLVVDHHLSRKVCKNVESLQDNWCTRLRRICIADLSYNTFVMFGMMDLRGEGGVKRDYSSFLISKFGKFNNTKWQPPEWEEGLTVLSLKLFWSVSAGKVVANWVQIPGTRISKRKWIKAKCNYM